MLGVRMCKCRVPEYVRVGCQHMCSVRGSEYVLIGRQNILVQDVRIFKCRVSAYVFTMSDVVSKYVNAGCPNMYINVGCLDV